MTARAPGRVALRRTRDRDEWDRIVDAAPASTPFHRWDFLELTESMLGVRVERFLVLAHNEPVGVFPVARGTGRGAAVSPAMPFPFLGPLVPPDVLGPAVRALRRRQLATGWLVARFDLAPGSTTPDAAAALRAAGVEVSEDATVVVDTAHGSVDELHAGMVNTQQRNARKAIKRGAEVRPARPGEVAAILPDFLREAYGVRDVPSPYPDDVGALVEAWAADVPWAALWVATVEDEPAGTIVVLTDGDVDYSWVGGCLFRFRSQSPNSLLHREVLARAVETGRASFDLVGWLDDSVGRFKVSFGGERRPYLVCVSSPVPAALRRRFRERLRR